MPPFRSSPGFSRAALAALLLLSAACAGKTADHRPDADAASPIDRDRALRDTLARVIGAEVRDVEPLGDDVVALAADSSAEARWLVVLEKGNDGRRIVRRVHTYLPVDTVPGRFQLVEWEGDGEYQLLAIGSARAHGSVAVEALLLMTSGEVFRYELTQEGGRDSLDAVWTPNLQSRPHLLPRLAEAAHTALLQVRQASASVGENAPIARRRDPLTAREALEAARQRLGWGVLEAWPIAAEDAADRHIAVLYAGDLDESHIALLTGEGHVYRLVHDTRPVLGGQILPRSRRFGVVHVDGKPWIFEVNDASGSAGPAYAGAMIGLSGTSFSVYAGGSGNGAPAFDHTGDATARQRAWLDSAVAVAVGEDYGDGRGVPPARIVALQAEQAWTAAKAARGHSALPRALPGPVPDADDAHCVVDDGGVEWVARVRGGLWMHDRAADSSRVAWVPPDAEWSPVSSLVVGRRYVWMGMMRADSAKPPALLAFDKELQSGVDVPAPELSHLPDACGGLCGLMDPLRVQDGHLVVGDQSLSLPPEFSDPRELANAKGCIAR